MNGQPPRLILVGIGSGRCAAYLFGSLITHLFGIIIQRLFIVRRYRNVYNEQRTTCDNDNVNHDDVQRSNGSLPFYAERVYRYDDQ